MFKKISLWSKLLGTPGPVASAPQPFHFYPPEFKKIIYKKYFLTFISVPVFALHLSYELPLLFVHIKVDAPCRDHLKTYALTPHPYLFKVYILIVFNWKWF